MLILNQERDEVVNLDNVEAFFVEVRTKEKSRVSDGLVANIDIDDKTDEYRIFAGCTSRKSVILGRYESGARARDILWEIMMVYTLPDKKIYEMPKA